MAKTPSTLKELAEAGNPKSERLWEVIERRRAQRGAYTTSLFANEQELWEVCSEYLRWAEANPVQGYSAPTTHNGKLVHNRTNNVRLVTMGGLCAFIGVTEPTWNGWADENHPTFRPDLAPIVKAMRAIIRDEKLTAAAANIVNANVVMRDLGLSDSNIQINRNEGDAGGEVHVADSDQTETLFAHPDDPDGTSGWLFTRRQLDQGIPFPGGTVPKTGDKPTSTDVTES